jgi:ribonuclease P protein subunit POP4
MTPITPQNILRHELIGLDVRVASAKNPSIRSAKGRIVNETRNILTIFNKGRERMIPKNVAIFRFKLQDGTVVDVDGARLVARPENRLTTKVKHW